MSIFNKNSETPRKEDLAIINKKFIDMGKNNKVKPVLKRNGIKNNYPIVYQCVIKISLMAMP